MRLTLALLLGLMTLWISACSPGQPNLYRSSNEKKIYYDGRSVDVTNVENEAEARPFAEQYCSSRGETAHFARMELISYHRIATLGASFSCASQRR
jgi:hypothetical protein